ncbi:MAG: hypothetical protein GQ564_23645 [Bacteroidales bacterium]|nr:hypothetical protein [Bacteroidales bacterium]
MEHKYDLSNLAESDYESIAQELIQSALNLDLQYYEGSVAAVGVDFWKQNKKGQAEVVAMVIDHLNAKEWSYGGILAKIKKDIEFLNAEEYIIIDYLKQDPSFYSDLIKNSGIKISYYGIDWIQEQLHNYPKIVEKYKLKSASAEELNETEVIEKPKSLKAQLKKLATAGRNFFALGHMWGTEDQIPRFLKEGIWENGHKEKRTNDVIRIRKGDVVFIQSSSSGSAYMRIKAIGVVTENKGDGHQILVNWNQVDPIDIQGFGAYTNAISQIGGEYLILIFKDLYEKLPKVFDIIDNLTGIIPQKELLIDFDLFAKQKFDIIQDKEFYFQKALDVLEEIKMFKAAAGFLKKGEIEASKSAKNIQESPYEKLNVHWNKRGKLKTGDFIISLQKKQAELVPLFELISKFLSYADSKAWNKQKLNEYKNKRSIARTDVSQNNLVNQFIQYAINDFELVSEQSDSNFYHIIKYLENPVTRFNIISDKHRKLISKFFLGQIYTGDIFHSNLKEYFDKYGVDVSNPQNLTHLYTSTIYDKAIRKHWDTDASSVGNVSPDLNGTNGEDIPSDDKDQNKESEQIKDKIPFHLDKVVKEDKLGREPVAKAFVRMLKKDIFTKKLDHSFMVHLQGEWGAGKSSFLQLIKKNLNSNDEKWVVVDYNAWQNQHISPPWWTLIDQIYRQSKSELNWWFRSGLWIKENLRRVIWYRGWQKILALALTIAFIISLKEFGSDIYKFLTGQSFKSVNIEDKDKIKALSDFAKLLLTLGTGVGVIYSFSRFLSSSFLMKTPEDAVSFMSKASDPMSRIKKHFNNLVNNINKRQKDNRINNVLKKVGFKVRERQLAIFIDDIDRCNKEFIVKLLEGIQTLFKEKRVLYIVAGDKKWITTSFGNTYNEFANNDQDNNHLGDLFLEKAFQLSFRMPNVAEEAKKEYWNYILGIEDTVEDTIDDDIEDLRNAAVELAATTEDIADPVYMKEIEKSFNLSRDAVSNIVIEEKNSDNEELQHLLKDFHTIIDPNPRSIKRLANNYTMIRSTLIAERKSLSADKIFRWLVIEDLHPKIKIEIKNISSFEELEAYFDKEILEGNADNVCKNLLLGGENIDGEALQIEEIKNIIGF